MNAFKFLVVDFVVLISSVEPSLLYLELCMIVSCFRLLSLSVEISFSCSIFIQRIHMMGIFFFLNFILSYARCLCLLCKCKCNFVQSESQHAKLFVQGLDYISNISFFFSIYVLNKRFQVTNLLLNKQVQSWVRLAWEVQSCTRQ